MCSIACFHGLPPFPLDRGPDIPFPIVFPIQLQPPFGQDIRILVPQRSRLIEEVSRFFIWGFPYRTPPIFWAAFSPTESLSPAAYLLLSFARLFFSLGAYDRPLRIRVLVSWELYTPLVYWRCFHDHLFVPPHRAGDPPTLWCVKVFLHPLVRFNRWRRWRVKLLTTLIWA